MCSLVGSCVSWLVLFAAGALLRGFIYIARLEVVRKDRKRKERFEDGGRRRLYALPTVSQARNEASRASGHDSRLVAIIYAERRGRRGWIALFAKLSLDVSQSVVMLDC